MIKTVIFDFGGVIAHFIREGAVRRFEQLGLNDADQQLDNYCQNGIFLEVEKGAITAEGFCERLSEMCGREVSYEEARWAWLGFFTETPTEKLDYITALRPRYRTYVLSNTNPYIMSWARTSELSAQGRPLDDYFDAIFTSYELGVVKPDSRFFEHVLEATGSLPHETVFVDDGPHNVAAAEALGIHTLCPANGEDWREALTELLDRLNRE